MMNSFIRSDWRISLRQGISNCCRYCRKIFVRPWRVWSFVDCMSINGPGDPPRPYLITCTLYLTIHTIPPILSDSYTFWLFFSDCIAFMTGGQFGLYEGHRRTQRRIWGVAWGYACGCSRFRWPSWSYLIIKLYLSNHVYSLYLILKPLSLWSFLLSNTPKKNCNTTTTCLTRQDRHMPSLDHLDVGVVATSTDRTSGGPCKGNRGDEGCVDGPTTHPRHYSILHCDCTLSYIILHNPPPIHSLSPFPPMQEWQYCRL